MTLSPTEILSGVRVDEGRCLHALGGARALGTGDAPGENFVGRSYIGSASPVAIDLIGGCALNRTALMRCLAASETALATEGFKDIEAWATAPARAANVILVAAEYPVDMALIGRQVRSILEIAPATRVIVLADIGSQAMLIDLLKQGVKGVVPSDSTIDNVIFATRLVRRGGLFTPLLGVAQARPAIQPEAGKEAPLTPRQVEVIRELRKGSSNKDIARDLQMSELTVRVHIRNIMRRLKARSRTEIVAKTSLPGRPALAAS